MQEEQELPKGWVKTTLGDAYHIIGGGTPATENKAFWEGNIPWISSADIDATSFKVTPWRYVTEAAVEASATNVVPTGTVVVVTRVGLGKVCLAETALCFSQDSQGLISKYENIDAIYALHFVTKAARAFKAQSRGTTISGITKKQLQEVEFLLPPLPEQRRIVAKLEELFSRLDAGVAAVRQSQQLLKRYRQSVLHAAVTGALTSTWRERRVRDGQDEQDLIWKQTTIGEVTLNLDNKRKPVSKKIRNESNGEYPYYGANGQTGWINDFIFDEELILVVEDETFTGRTKPFCYKIEGKTWVNNHAHVLKAKECLSTDYLNYSLAFYPFTPLTTGTTGRKKLTKAALTGAPYQLPSLAEQAEIVAEVERRLSTIDALELTLTAELKRAERLRQSLLHRAFTGRLVPQDATDEPAGELLARLQSAPPGPAKAKASRTKAAAAPVAGEAVEGKRRGRPRKVEAVEAMAEVVEAPLPAGTQTTLGF